MSFALSVPAAAGSVRQVRVALLDWLTGAGWPAADHDPLVFAVAEAVTNAIEHAYPAGGPDDRVTVNAYEQSRGAERRIIASVTDRGAWRPPAGIEDGRPRGIFLMRAFAETVDIRPSAAGTTVTIASTPVGR